MSTPFAQRRNLLLSVAIGFSFWFFLFLNHPAVHAQSLLDRLKCPYQSKIVRSMGKITPNAQILFDDLDGDGLDESIEITNSKRDDNLSMIIMHNPFNKTIMGFNAAGRFDYLGKTDYDGDGQTDVIFSLTTQRDISLVKISPFHSQKEPEIVRLVWKKDFKALPGNVMLRNKIFDPEDPNHIFLAIITTFSQSPRYLLGFDLRSNKTFLKFPMGPIPESICTARFTGRKTKEILIGSYACANGAIANDMGDWKSWLVLLSRRGKVLFKKSLGGYNTITPLSPKPFLNQKGEPSVFVVRFCNGGHSKEADFVGIWNWAHRNNFPKLHFPQGIETQEPVFFKNPLTGKNEVIFFTKNGCLTSVDEDLKIIRMKKPSFIHHLESARVQGVANLLGDYRPELIVLGERRAYILTLDYHLLCSIPVKNQPKIVHGVERGKVDLFIEKQDGFGYIVSFGRNPIFYLFRGAVVLLLLILLYLPVAIRKRKQKIIQKRRLESNIFRAWVLESLDTGIIIFDHAGRLESINRKAREILGFSGEVEELEKEFLSRLQGHPFEILRNILRKLELSPGKKVEESLTVRQGDELVRYQISAEVLQDEAGHPLGKAISIRDETEMGRSRELIAWSEMAARLAHEIKIPLSSLLLASEKLKKIVEAIPSDAAKANPEKYLSYLFREIDRLEHIAETMMQLASIRQSEFVEINVNLALREALERVTSLFGKGIRLETNLDEDLPAVWGNFNQLVLAFENILKNSLDAVSVGDTIHVSSYLAQGLQGEKQGQVVVEISDTGIGIPENLQEKIFQPYFSNKEMGTGLGLSIVKKIIEDHFGHIRFESTEGIGTVFWIYLPPAKGAGQEEAE